MPRANPRVTDAMLAREAERLVSRWRNALRELALKTLHSQHRLQEYALLTVVTNTPRERALTYLKDCKTPESAQGRLLMRAAERSFREVGEHNGPDYTN